MFHPGTPPVIKFRNSGNLRREFEYVKDPIRHVCLHRAELALFEPGKNGARNLDDSPLQRH